MFRVSGLARVGAACVGVLTRVSEGSSPHKSVRCWAYPTWAGFGLGVNVVGPTWSTFLNELARGLPTGRGIQTEDRGTPRSVQGMRSETARSTPMSVPLRRAALGVRNI